LRHALLDALRDVRQLVPFSPISFTAALDRAFKPLPDSLIWRMLALEHFRDGNNATA
jgi:hypothetical protein